MAFNLEKFFFDTPIYSHEKIDSDDINSDEFDALFSRIPVIDIEGYNPWNQVDTTFVFTRSLTWEDNNFKNSGGFGEIHLSCKRYLDEFRFYVYWNPKEQIIIKVGQLPTVADFHLGEVKQYKKVISLEKLKEFTRAIGLAANGIGIGSFVYLRRIFEHLINEAYDYALKDGVVAESNYQKARMDEKIEMLHSYLPPFLVENKSMYSILSLGIHELNEQTCLAHFDTIRVGIEIILDEKLEIIKRKEKIEAAKKKLSELKGKIKE
jgi:hypothetical protein